MSLIKSFSVGNGDMFYIDHNADSFSIIDCNLNNKEEVILTEIKNKHHQKGITRFISTHYDKDHILGLSKLNETISINCFYCVKNQGFKDYEDEDFNTYKELKNSENSLFLTKDCIVKWLNKSDNERHGAGISILWPDIENGYFKEELNKVNTIKNYSPNNISPVIRYSLENGVTVLWFGDLETEFIEKIKNNLNITKTDVVFAPHHGRKSGKIPKELLDKINPKLIIIGEGESENIDYYSGYNTITQNSSGDILLDCTVHKVHIYTSNEYSIPFSLDYDSDKTDIDDMHYIGTLKTND